MATPSSEALTPPTSPRGRPLPVAEVAERLGCTPAWIYRLVAEGRIPHHRVAGRLVGGRARRGRIVIYEQPFEEFLSACEVTAAQAAEQRGIYG